MTEKDTYKYHVKLGKQVVDRGVTYDLERREAEMQERFPGCSIQQIGRRTTHVAALKWLNQGGKRSYRIERQGIGLANRIERRVK